jgi:hypothetical protein
MNKAHPLRPRLGDLLRGIEAQDEPEATAIAQSLIQELEETKAVAATQGTSASPVRFSALYHAVAREVRSGERAIAAGNWMGAAKSVRVAISILPE